MRPGFVARHLSGPACLGTVVLLALSSAGCATARKGPIREDVAAQPEVSSSEGAPSTPTVSSVRSAVEPNQDLIREQVSPEHVEAHVRAEVAHRMPATRTATRRSIATTVLKESTRAGVDPLLVVALIHVESSFNPRARSRKGALGLMQVRVPTFREQLKRPNARRADALDPHTNVQAGVRYFRRLLDTFGATDLALMAYNAGPARLQRLLVQGTIPAGIRDYSRKVEDEFERIRNALLRPQRTDTARSLVRNGPVIDAVVPSPPQS